MMPPRRGGGGEAATALWGGDAPAAAIADGWTGWGGPPPAVAATRLTDMQRVLWADEAAAAAARVWVADSVAIARDAAGGATLREALWLGLRTTDEHMLWWGPRRRRRRSQQRRWEQRRRRQALSMPQRAGMMHQPCSVASQR